MFNHYQVNLATSAASRAPAHFGNSLGNFVGSCSHLPDQQEEEIEESIHEEEFVDDDSGHGQHYDDQSDEAKDF